jgi:iron complex transport system substrate-binding protein
VTSRIVLVLLAALLVSGCESAKPVTTGTRRIVTVGGAVTETVYALGAGDEVVAVDTSSVYPEVTEKLPKVGYQRLLSTEGILALSPDLVIAADEAGPPAVLEQLMAAGVRVEKMPAVKNVDEAVARIRRVGTALGKPADELAKRVQQETSAAVARAPKHGPTFVLLYARGAGTLMVAGGDTSGSAMVELAGGRNAVRSVAGYKPLSPEVMIEAAPDVIVVPARGLTTLGGVEGLLRIPGVADTPAGKQRRIIAFDDLLLLGFGPRLAQAVEQLSAQL